MVDVSVGDARSHAWQRRSLVNDSFCAKSASIPTRLRQKRIRMIVGGNWERLHSSLYRSIRGYHVLFSPSF
jgi:hypothetical protein